MTTGAEFANFVNKRLAGFVSFSTQLIDYLRELNRVTVDTLFDQGTFNERIPLVAGGNDLVRISLKPGEADGLVHEGDGHILDLEQIMSGGTPQRDELFENTIAVVYDVGAGFVARPMEIQINPNTGKPEYVKYQEYIGDEADPDAVTDNGNGTITFRVDSLVDSAGSESIAGRQVRVFMKVPADGALTEALAIEVLTVAFGGGQNTITTAAAMGQAVVSTTATDYTVQLVGLSIRRQSGTSPVTGTGRHFFIGIVTGVGAGSTPTVLSNGAQKLISTSVLSETGAAQIGVDSTQFTTSVITGDDEGGLGTTGDPDDPSTVQDALENTDKALIRNRAFTATIVDGTKKVLGWFSGANAIDQINTIDDGGRYLIHEDNGTDYEFNTQAGFGSATKNPEVVGAEGGATLKDYPTVAVPSGASAIHKLRGRFRRLHLKSNDSTYGYSLDYSASLGGANIEDCAIDSGHMRLNGFDGIHDNPQRAIVVRDTEFRPGTGPGPYETALALIRSDADAVGVIFENCLITGPHSSASGAGAVLHIDGFDPDESGDDLEFAFITFKDCQILHENDTTIPTVLIENMDGSTMVVNFENVTVYGIPDSAVGAVTFTVNNAAVNAHNLRIHCPGGRGVRCTDIVGVWKDIYVTCESNRTTDFTTDQNFFAGYPGQNDRCQSTWYLENININLRGCWGDAAGDPPVEIGGVDGTQKDYSIFAESSPTYHVNGMHVMQRGGIMKGTMVGFWSIHTGHNDIKGYGQPTVTNLDVNHGSVGLWDTDVSLINTKLVNPSVVEFVATDDDQPIIARNIMVYGFKKRKPSQPHTTFAVIYIQGCKVYDVHINSEEVGGGLVGEVQCGVKLKRVSGASRPLLDGFTRSGGSGPLVEYIDGQIILQDGCDARNIDFSNWTNLVMAASATCQGIKMSGANNTVENVRAPGITWLSSSVPTVIDLGSGDFCYLINATILADVYSGRSAAAIVGTGKGQRVSHCTFRVDGTDFAEAVTLTGDVSMINNNIILSEDGTTPTITNSGTDALSSDNILAINQ